MTQSKEEKLKWPILCLKAEKVLGAVLCWNKWKSKKQVYKNAYIYIWYMSIDRLIYIYIYDIWHIYIYQKYLYILYMEIETSNMSALVNNSKSSLTYCLFWPQAQSGIIDLCIMLQYLSLVLNGCFVLTIHILAQNCWLNAQDDFR